MVKVVRAAVLLSLMLCGVQSVHADVLPNPNSSGASGGTSAGASGSTSAAAVAPNPAAVAPAVDPNAPLSDADKWVRDRFNPGGQDAATEAKKAKHPVRSFLKGIAKGTAKELGTSLHLMAEDSAFVFSVQNGDPYDSNTPPRNRQVIVMEMTMTDGSSCYLHHFPDGSFAVEGGFADGTVILPRTPTQYTVKYPNGVVGNLVRQKDLMTIHRPDNTVTTFKRTAGGGWEVNNSKLGYIGEAHPDDVSNNIQLNTWSNSASDDL